MLRTTEKIYAAIEKSLPDTALIKEWGKFEFELQAAKYEFLRLKNYTVKVLQNLQLKFYIYSTSNDALNILQNVAVHVPITM